MVYYEESGKNAIVTGAERGIGKGIALRLAQAGYNVFFTYYFKDSYAEELKRSIEKLGRRCVALKADFRDPSVVETVVKSAAKSLGGIDLLVNNAAIMPPRAYQYEYTAEHMMQSCLYLHPDKIIRLQAIGKTGSRDVNMEQLKPQDFLMLHSPEQNNF